MITIGIDPGLSGAVAFVTDDDLWRVAVHDMPVMPYGKAGKNALDVARLTLILTPSVGHAKNVWIEQVSAMPGNGAVSMFNFGMSYWGAAGVAAGLGYTVRLVRPVDWKKHFGLTSKKGEALALARKLFPAVELHLQKHDGRAEALLIAKYGELHT